MISFDDFKKVELTVGEIISAEKVPDTDKLLKLSVDFGIKPKPAEPVGLPELATEGQDVSGEREEKDIRQIISGIAPYFPDPSVLVGKKTMFVTNIPPRMIKGLESNGMILAVSTEDGKFSLLSPDASIPAGTKAK